MGVVGELETRVIGQGSVKMEGEVMEVTSSSGGKAKREAKGGEGELNTKERALMIFIP